VDGGELLTVDSRPHLVSGGVRAREAHALGDQPPPRVHARSGRLLAQIAGVVLGEVLTPAGADQDRVPAAHAHAVGPGGILQVLPGDLEARGEGIGGPAGDHASDVEEDAS
jgi:hypothetical protein